MGERIELGDLHVSGEILDDVTLISQNPLGICIEYGAERIRRFVDFTEMKAGEASEFGFDEVQYSLIKTREKLELPERTYLKVTIEEITALGIRIRHEGGLALLHFPSLPESIQSNFCYSPESYAIALEAEQTFQREGSRLQVTSQNYSQEDKIRLVQQKAKEAVAASQPQRRDYAEIGGNLSSDRTARNYAQPRYTQRSYLGSTDSWGSSQCAGVTQKGMRCMNRVASGSYCHHHR